MYEVKHVRPVTYLYFNDTQNDIEPHQCMHVLYKHRKRFKSIDPALVEAAAS